MRSTAREVTVFAFFAALSVAMTWPLARDLTTAVSDLGDPLLNTWILDWSGRSLVRNPLGLFQSPMYYPAHLTHAFSEHLVGIALLIIPLQLAGVGAVAVYNVAMLLGFALSGYGGYVLSRVVTGSTLASLAGGIIFAFVPHKFDHIPHLQIVSSGWIPLLLAAVLAYWKRPGRLHAALLVGAFVMNGLTNIHYFLFGSLTAVVTVVVLAIVEPRRERRFWGTLVAAFVAGGLVLLPFLLPYRIVADEYAMKRTAEVAAGGSGTASAWLWATPLNVLYGQLGPRSMHRHEFQLFPGFAALFLSAAALFLWAPQRRPAPAIPPEGLRPPSRRTLRLLDIGIVLMVVLSYLGLLGHEIDWHIRGTRIVSFDNRSFDSSAMVLLVLVVARLTLRYPDAFGGGEGRSLRGAALRSRFPAGAFAAVAWIVIGFLGSLGMNAFFHAFLFRRFEMFQAVRAPVRWAVIAYPGLAVLASMGALALAMKLEGRRRVIAFVVIAALVTLDLRTRILWSHAEASPAPVYRWLAKEKVGPIAEIPLRGDGMEYQYDLGRTAHQLPSFNGTSGFEPPFHVALHTAWQRDDLDRMMDGLEKEGCRLIIVHRHVPSGSTPSVRAWLRRSLAAGRLSILRTFDHGIGGDYVFAVTRNLSSWRQFREADTPDGAGHLLDMRLARMLDGQSTYTESTFGSLESPSFGQVVTGPLDLHGWALSPFSIRRATILLEGGSVRIDVPLTRPRPDLVAIHPWYPFVPKPGFQLTIPDRPRGVHQYTDVRLEIEDAAGRVAWTPVIEFQWVEQSRD